MTDDGNTAPREDATGEQLAAAPGAPGAALATRLADEAQRLRGQLAANTVADIPGSGGAFEHRQVTQPLAFALSWVSLTVERLADAHGTSSALSDDLIGTSRWVYGAGAEMLRAAQAELAGPVLPQPPAGLADLAANIEAAARQLHLICERAGPDDRMMLTPADRAAMVPALASAVGAMSGCASELAALRITEGERDALGSAVWQLAMAHSILPEDAASRAAEIDPGNANWLHDRIRWLPAACQALQNELAALGPITLEPATPATEPPAGLAFTAQAGTRPPARAGRPAAPVTAPAAQAHSRRSR